MGNGFNYVREIMQMNLPDTPDEKAIRAFRFIGDVAEMPGWSFDHGRRVVRVVNHQKMEGWISHAALPGDVIRKENKLYSWTYMGWCEFTPGPCTIYDGPRPEIKEEKENMATEIRYLGEAQSAMRNGLKGPSVMIKGIWERDRNLDLVLSGDTLYCYVENKNEWARISTIAFTEKVQYNRIPHGWMTIKNVVFNDPATIVMWEDGTKTIVKCGENDEYDPEKGLAMAVAKKAFGNQGNYYNQIRKWLPKDDEPLSIELPTNGIKDALNRVFGDPKRVKAAKKLTEIQELIVDMTFRGATKGELVRAIRFSKDLIDASKGVDVDIAKSVAELGIAELEAKYQPK